MRTALRASALATAVVLATALPAHAARVVVTDATSDVASVDAESEVVAPVGTRVNTDLARTVIRHDRSAITVKASYVDLAKNEDLFTFGVDVLTNEGLKREVSVFAMDMARKGKVELTKPKGGTSIPCKGLKHVIDYTQNTISLTLPRTCVSDPRWVKLHVYAVTIGDSLLADDGVSPTVAEKLTWTKRIKVG